MLEAPTQPDLATPQNFSLGEARGIVKDCFRPNPWIYWTDFLISYFVGLRCFWFVPRMENYVQNETTRQVLQVVCFVVAALLFYRIGTFTHELVHLRGKAFVPFRFVWNLLCGIPFLIPSYMYYTHTRHHIRKFYGTMEDGEYLSLGQGPRWKILLYLGESFLVPIVAVVRFLILAPLSWICPPLRRQLHMRASSLVIDPQYVRPLPTNKEARIWQLQETATCAYTWTAGVMWYTGSIPADFVLRAYVIAVVIMLINSIRTLGAHRFRHSRQEMSFIEQLLDSINYPRSLWTAELWAPLGMRYHALHHLFPSLPYHNLGIAHQRLMAQLPSDSIYRQTEVPTLPTALAQLWHDAKSGKYPLHQEYHTARSPT